MPQETEPHFTPDEQRTLAALVDTLIPADDWPGGGDSGVIDYLTRQFSRDLIDQITTYRTALALLDEEARAIGASTFADLDIDRRTDLLKALEVGQSTASWPMSPKHFIETAASHAAEGFYGDPGNGGNRDEVAWKMIGFEVTA